MISAEYLWELYYKFQAGKPPTPFQRGYLTALEELIQIAEAAL